jgi:mannose-6-phosphate isomerase-like protein (cupin superfamily)
MRRLLAVLLVFVSCASLEAQQPAAPESPVLPATDIPAAAIEAFLKALPRDAVSDRPIRVVNVGGYQVGVYGVFRPKTLPGDAILHETTTSEVYYMLEGTGTLVTGGTIAGDKTTIGPASRTRGSRIDGGVTRKMVKGDMVIIPGRTPHWWSALDSDIQYLIIRPDPNSRLSAK